MMLQNKFTKIMATISDKRCDVDFLTDLFNAGLNCVRLNSAHLSKDGFFEIVENVRKVSDSLGVLVDTKGPEIRTTTNAFDCAIKYHKGEATTFVGDPDGTTTRERICLTYPDIADDLHEGDHLLLDDGTLDFEVTSVADGVINATALNDGALNSRKSVNIPGVKINLPSLQPRDVVNIGYAIDLGVDFIAHSFVRSAQDVRDVQALLDARGSKIKIIAKIENQEGIDNFDEILAESYGILIARGDLGIEVPGEKIPGLQRQIIDKCIRAHKPVIVATQMLHSMIDNPRPTRAEVSDVANAVYQRADALLLTGETAYGKYPVEAVATMARIALEVESESAGEEPRVVPPYELNVTSFLARQAVASSTKLGTKAIVTDSYTGRTARYISSFRGPYPTLAICYHNYVRRLLSISYGVWAFHQDSAASSRMYLRNALLQLVEQGVIERDNRIAYLGGGFGEGRGTTFLEINYVSDVIDNYAIYSLPNLEDVDQPMPK